MAKQFFNHAELSKDIMSNNTGNTLNETLPMITAEIIGSPWISQSFAKAWFKDALNEARHGIDIDSRRREIIFAVAFAESYLVEWVRDDILKKDFGKFIFYFPINKRMNAADKWKEIPKQLCKDKLLRETPILKATFWVNWTKLIDYRDGFIHAVTSCPENLESLRKKGIAKIHEMSKIKSGWATNVVIELVKEFHKAANMPMPEWLQIP